VQSRQVFRFADLEVHEHELKAMRGGRALDLEPKAFRVLVYLIKHAGHLVTKSELIGAVWGETAVTDNSLTRVIAVLRRVLEDDPHQPRFIETVSTAGYRFICPVVSEQSPSESGRPLLEVTELLTITGTGGPDTAISAAEEKPSSWQRRWRWPVLAVCAVLAGSALGFIWYLHQPLPPPHIVRYEAITSDPRWTGKHVVGSDSSRLFLRLEPAAFAEVPLGGGEISVIPVKLPGAHQPWGIDGYEISPDGSSAAFRDFDEKADVGALWVVGISGSPIRYLAKGNSPSFSSDGSRVIYSLPDGFYTIPTAGGEPEQLLSLLQPGMGPCAGAFGFVFSPDGSKIRFTRRCRQRDQEGSSFPSHLGQYLFD
jgi:DNA-binding winged helix-turn-helix (wHTH) protein